MADKKRNNKKNKPGNGPRTGPNTTEPDVWSDQDQTAYDMLVAEFETYDLGSLASVILTYLQDGVDPRDISFLLQKEQVYMDRFAGNEEIKKRIKAGETGLRVLTPAEYVQQEAQYREALSYYALPEGFYDDPSDLAGWIGKGVSVREVWDRAKMAKDTVMGSPEVVAELRRYYPELSDGDVAAYILDQKRALPIIERKIQAANIGAGAAFQNLSVSRQRAEDLAAYGVSADQARQGYSAIAEALPTASKLADIDRVEFSQADLEDEVFKGNAAAAEKRKRLASRERARFSASGGSNQYSFTSDKGDY